MAAAMVEFIATSIARRLVARMRATHERRRISVFAGPPGIGKTTAIDYLATELEKTFVVVKIDRRGAREVLVLQHVLDALRQLTAAPWFHSSNAIWELRRYLFNAICSWAGAEPVAVRRGDHDPAGFPKLTLVFDEAQNLSRQAIEALRYWNDADRCYAPFPIGLIFVGNSEFSLQADLDGRSVVSAAVADRAMYVQTYDYSDVTDDDLRLYLRSRRNLEPDAVEALIAFFGGSRVSRSFRRVDDLIDELPSRSGSITLACVLDVLALT
jgi:type II secretory pathway predicted ATPase ExeA